MTGLDKIIDQIGQEAQNVAAKIRENTEDQVSSIVRQAQLEAEKNAVQIAQKADVQCADILARGKSAAALVKRKAVLQAKQQIIGNMLKEAKHTLLTLPDKEYFALLLQMVKKYALHETGQIAFNAKDTARMPENMQEKINQASDGMLVFAKEPVQIDGGFILIYGGIEENCSFEALFAGANETLQDEVHSLLFS